MYRKDDGQISIYEFISPFGELDPNNRWVKLAEIIPWKEIDEKYAKLLSQKVTGAPAKISRMAFGALYIKEKLKYSDDELVTTIQENPYMQFFLGLHEYQYKPLFASTTIVYFRKRLTPEILLEINEMIAVKKIREQIKIESAAKKSDKDNNDDNRPGVGDCGKQGNSKETDGTYVQGKLILDATCTPADIAYPTDLGLLNESRERLEETVTILHETSGKKERKPRMYSQKARADYLSESKKRKHTKKSMRKSIKKQLGYVKRDLRIVDEMLEKYGDTELSKRQKEQLETIRLVYAQQKEMYDGKKHKVDARIVSISQPYVRPIVRGKAGAGTEFGAKVAIAVVNGFVFIEKMSFDGFNEGESLIDSVEKYKERFGCYPEAVLADTIYRKRKNRQYCTERGIRLSGPRLGRPPKERNKEAEAIAYRDNCERNCVEGKFGEGKRRYGMARIKAKLKETNLTVIAMQFLVMNIEHLRCVLCALFSESRGLADLGNRSREKTANRFGFADSQCQIR